LAVIDDLPLRRASTAEFLRTHLREGTVAFRNVAEFLSRSGSMADTPACVIVHLGSRSLTEAEHADQVRALVSSAATVPLIVLSDRETLDEVIAAFRCGARGLIPTSLEPALAIEAIRMVRAGGSFFPAAVLTGLKPDAKIQNDPDEPLAEVAHHWAPRQLAVLRLLVEGRANKEIARALALEESTVKVHVWRIMRKLNAVNRTEAALRGRRLQILASQAPSTPLPDLSSG
jgi:DNA-binding NarL/FixJ family response regulator